MFRILFSFLLAIAPPLQTAQAAEPIGAILAMQGDVAIYQNVQILPAYLGQKIYAGDNIATHTDGWAQIALYDQSLFSIPANSRFVVEDFKSDGQSPTLIARLLSGAIKFISGQTASSNPDGMQIKFGTVAAAIRGTSGIIEHQTEKGSTLTLLSGSIGLFDTSNQQIRQISRSGWGIDISSQGRVSSIIRRPPGSITQLLKQTTTSFQEQQQRFEIDTEQQTAPQEGQDKLINLSGLFSAKKDTLLSAHQLNLLNALDPDKLKDKNNAQINLDAALLDFALAGGIPLWSSYFDEGYIGHPPAQSHVVDYDLYNEIYAPHVSLRYQGKVSFNTDTLELVAVNHFDARGQAGFHAEFDYDKVELTGQFWVKDVAISSVTFPDPEAVTLALPTLQHTDLLNELEIAHISLTAAEQNGITPRADATLAFSLGSITDGQSVIDGRVGLFDITLTPQDSPDAALASQVILAGSR